MWNWYPSYLYSLSLNVQYLNILRLYMNIYGSEYLILILIIFTISEYSFMNIMMVIVNITEFKYNSIILSIFITHHYSIFEYDWSIMNMYEFGDLSLFVILWYEFTLIFHFRIMNTCHMTPAPRVLLQFCQDGYEFISGSDFQLFRLFWGNISVMTRLDSIADRQMVSAMSGIQRIIF